uniref:Glycosyl transferase family 2 n=1 Tax=Cyanothece sp. (strain PCC 7425 / ATCC 29141) TaxID=395961 RepID=B8HXQ7_CYAP4
MSNSQPRVSIGLPVYNGENFIREAIDSILAQTFTDFELIISDNASTDRTESICRDYMAQDPRVRYCRNSRNLGVAGNFTRLLELAQGEYFKWASHDDKIAPELIEQCVQVLDQDPKIVLCHSRVVLIDQRGQVLDPQHPLFSTTFNLTANNDSPQVARRFASLISGAHNCYQGFGLIRTASARLAMPVPGYTGGDRIVLARLALLGRFHEIPEALFFVRRHPAQDTHMFDRYKQSRSSSTWFKLARTGQLFQSHPLYTHTICFNPNRAGTLMLPHWEMLRDYFLAVQETPARLRGLERLGCYLQLLVWMAQEWRNLLRDLLAIVVQPSPSYTQQKRFT